MRISTRVQILLATAAVTFSATPSLQAAPAPSNNQRRCGTCFDCANEVGSSRVVRLWWYNQTRLKDSDLERILEVVNDVWAPYGIALTTGSRDDALKVIVSKNTMHGTEAGAPIAVGDTLFTDGHANPYIHLWLGGAELLARNSDSDGRAFALMPPVERDTILVRMLGVALAHELGHYLLDSSDHSAGGLLSSTLTAHEMERPNPAHLRLTKKQAQLMCRCVASPVAQ